MSIINVEFIKKSDNVYSRKNRNLFFASIGGISLVFFSSFFIPELIKIGEFNFSFLFGLFGYLVISGTFFFILAMGLFTTTTEINFNTHKIKLQTRNIFNVRHEQVSSIDNVRISSITMGISDATRKKPMLSKQVYSSFTKMVKNWMLQYFQKKQPTFQNGTR
jgi:hypothetical protein